MLIDSSVDAREDFRVESACLFCRPRWQYG